MSNQDVLRESCTVPICPRCRKPMMFVAKTRIMFTDARAQASYRCETCGTEAKRTVKYP